jgi:RNA polymerase nonessential primary-like sigma factor
MNESTPKDYAVQIRIKNNWLLARMRAAGFSSVNQLAKASGLNATVIGKYLNLKRAPMSRAFGREGQWTKTVQRMAETLKCMPEDLFPPQHIDAPLKRNTAEIALGVDELPALLAQAPAMVLGPDAALDRAQAEAAIVQQLAALSAREERIIRLRFGFNGPVQTCLEIAAAAGLSTTRVQQIERKALEKLQHPSRAGALRTAADTFAAQADGAL